MICLYKHYYWKGKQSWGRRRKLFVNISCETIYLVLWEEAGSCRIVGTLGVRRMTILWRWSAAQIPVRRWLLVKYRNSVVGRRRSGGASHLGSNDQYQTLSSSVNTVTRVQWNNFENLWHFYSSVSSVALFHISSRLVLSASVYVKMSGFFEGIEPDELVIFLSWH